MMMIRRQLTIGDLTASEDSQVPSLPERELTLTGGSEALVVNLESHKYDLRVKRCFRKGREVAVACWRGENQLQVKTPHYQHKVEWMVVR